VKSDPFKSAAAQKTPAKVSGKPVAAAVTGKGNSDSHTTVAVQDNKAASNNKPARVINAVARRDPFVSPVVAMGATGSGCSSGKRCLAIDQVALKGVVRSDGGMIAVVVNAMDKAYFLRENDPVFNGYVLKITGDSIVFKETIHDKLGKPLTRDVTKTISRPVA
jgi:Tfp pilus assembly protein PilP